MSDEINSRLLDRAHEVREQYVGTTLPDVIDRMVATNQLDELEYLVSQAEKDLADKAREDYHGYDVYPGTRPPLEVEDV